MNICIVGWYGTETVGDRAILDGIFQIFQKKYDKFQVSIGSLYPLLTERTLTLDKNIFCKNSPGVKIDIFDTRKKIDLLYKIRNCQYCIMGGGPIMDLDELNIVLFAFKSAKRLKKKTILFGCGLGPLRQKHYQSLVKSIFAHSDLIIFRDTTALVTSQNIFGGKFLEKCHALSDPAILSIGQYLKNQNISIHNGDTLVINFREFPNGYEKYSATTEDLCTLVKQAADRLEKVCLVPMHTFFIGGDDRKYLTEIAFTVNKKNVIVMHKPLNIHETYASFINAGACIGMRYHSVVFQTLLHGNNFILDYSNRTNGKIISFIKDIDKKDFYKNRYINLSDPVEKVDANKILDTLKSNDHFLYSKDLYDDVLSSYINVLKIIE
jgi:polysaccharide pyruvyl transferase WcaK-like protein